MGKRRRRLLKHRPRRKSAESEARRPAAAYPTLTPVDSAHTRNALGPGVPEATESGGEPTKAVEPPVEPPVVEPSPESFEAPEPPNLEAIASPSSASSGPDTSVPPSSDPPDPPDPPEPSRTRHPTPHYVPRRGMLRGHVRKPGEGPLLTQTERQVLAGLAVVALGLVVFSVGTMFGLWVVLGSALLDAFGV